jgi:hypothetical protein
MLFQRTAFSAVLLYAQQLRVAFDVHRRLLLVQLGMPGLNRIEDEMGAWRQLSLFWARAAPLNAERSWPDVQDCS